MGWYRRLGNLVRSARMHREIDKELSFHIAERVDELVDSGMSRDDAMRTARRQFGNHGLYIERTRDMNIFSWLESAVQDLRHAARGLRKNPGFTAIAVLTLALGIGANTAIFSIVDAVLLQPLPYPESDRMVSFTGRFANGTTSPLALSGLMYHFWRENSQTMESLGAFTGGGFNIVTGEGARRVNGLQVTVDLFDALGVKPAMGRGFQPEDEIGGAPAVAVVSHGMWQTSLGGSPDVLGQEMMLNDQPFTVVGVMPDGFSLGGSDTSVYKPLVLTADPRDRGFNYAGIARLKPGVTLEQAEADTDRVYAQLTETYPGYIRNAAGIDLVLYQDFLNSGIRPLLLVLLAAVGAVLLIACGNVANLLLSRAAVRQKELVVRSAIGAGAGRIMRQLITESLLLASIAGAAGTLLAVWGVNVLVQLGPALNNFAPDASVNLRVLGFTIVLSLATGLVFGTIGSRHAWKSDPQEVLKASTARGQSPARRRLSGAMVVVQVALAMALLVSASLLIASFHRLQNIQIGFDPAGLLVVEYPLSSEKYTNPLAVAQFEVLLRERLLAIPGVLSAATASGAPLVRTLNHGAAIAGDPVEQAFYIEYRAVSPEYFGTLGMRLIRGRAFEEMDTAGSTPVVIINETLARRFPDGRDPIGSHLILAQGSPDEEAPREVIGVVGDVSDRPPGSPTDATVYVLRSQATAGFNRWAGFFYSAALIRTAGGVDLNRELRAAFAETDPTTPLARIRTVDEIASSAIGQQQFNMFVMSVFAVIALLLTVVGLYGVLSYQVVQRTPEIGVRLALGASQRQVLGIVLRRGLALAGFGIAAGVVAAITVTRLLATMLYGVTPTDSWAYFGVSGLLGVTAVLASYIPARRAAKIDPLVALRHQT